MNFYDQEFYRALLSSLELLLWWSITKNVYNEVFSKKSSNLENFTSKYPKFGTCEGVYFPVKLGS